MALSYSTQAFLYTFTQVFKKSWPKENLLRSKIYSDFAIYNEILFQKASWLWTFKA